MARGGRRFDRGAMPVFDRDEMKKNMEPLLRHLLPSDERESKSEKWVSLGSHPEFMAGKFNLFGHLAEVAKQSRGRFNWWDLGAGTGIPAMLISEYFNRDSNSRANLLLTDILPMQIPGITKQEQQREPGEYSLKMVRSWKPQLLSALRDRDRRLGSGIINRTNRVSSAPYLTVPTEEITSEKRAIERLGLWPAHIITIGDGLTLAMADDLNTLPIIVGQFEQLFQANRQLRILIHDRPSDRPDRGLYTAIEKLLHQHRRIQSRRAVNEHGNDYLILTGK